MRTVKMMINGVWQGDVSDTPELARRRNEVRRAFRSFLAIQ